MNDGDRPDALRAARGIIAGLAIAVLMWTAIVLVLR